MFLFYIGIALIALYPVIQSLRDDIAFDAYEKYMKRYGGYKLFYFLLDARYGFLCFKSV